MFTLSSSTPISQRTPDIYATGTFALDSTNRYWRIRFWDQMDDDGLWSTTEASFKMMSAPTTLQDLNYTYDAVGNITQIIDVSGTNAAASTTYTYDNLYRLTSASSTNAVTTNWLETYTYNDLGNLLTKSDIGSYTYAGTGFANPHAPTTVNGVSYSYDNAGNLTSKGTQTFTWDAWNRLKESANTGTSTAYTYDHTGQRVTQSVNRGSGTTTTIYWSKLYQTEGSTTTLSIFLPDGTLLATVEGNGVSTTTSIIHTDHLNSVALTSDKNGTLSELSAYYPYGAHRITDLPSSGTNVERGYIGQYEDGATTLSYLQARYYDGTRGQFLSQDPLVRRMGTDDRALQKLLIDPQQMNTYSYARNNPVNLSDPSGEAAQSIAAQVRAIQTQVAALSASIMSSYASGQITASQANGFYSQLGSINSSLNLIIASGGGGGGSAQTPSASSQSQTKSGNSAPLAIGSLSVTATIPYIERAGHALSKAPNPYVKIGGAILVGVGLAAGYIYSQDAAPDGLPPGAIGIKDYQKKYDRDLPVHKVKDDLGHLGGTENVYVVKPGYEGAGDVYINEGGQAKPQGNIEAWK